MKKNAYFVTGIDTEIGKTVTSAVIVQALRADYWKPVQAGDLHLTDSHKIEKLTDCPCIHPEAFRLNTPMSPHAAAEIDKVQIELNDFTIPQTDNDLIIEGAGGLYVPLNERDCMIDLIEKSEVPVILTVKNYLGSINHTLLSIKALQQRNIAILGLVYSGEEVESTERIIQKMTGVPTLDRIEMMPEVNAAAIEKAAESMRRAIFNATAIPYAK